jgi:hypothetical protein
MASSTAVVVSSLSLKSSSGSALPAAMSEFAARWKTASNLA